MKLKSFGCSFIFGTDLHDDGFRQAMMARKTHRPASRHTWPALLAGQLGYEYECHAWPGSGNLRILENVLLESLKPEPAIFVVGWTLIDRFDWTTVKDQWHTILPAHTNGNAEFYYRNLHSQYRDKLTNLIYVKSAIDQLRQKGHRFIMTHMDDLLWEMEWHCNPAITSLQYYAKPCFSDFDGLTFLDWSSKHGYAISETRHPLEEAHQAASDFVYKNFDSFIKS